MPPSYLPQIYQAIPFSEKHQSPRAPIGLNSRERLGVDGAEIDSVCGL